MVTKQGNNNFHGQAFAYNQNTALSANTFQLNQTGSPRGQSGHPFAEFGRQRFERRLCPAAEEALTSTIAIHWNDNYTVAHVEQIAGAIQKVANHYATA